MATSIDHTNFSVGDKDAKPKSAGDNPERRWWSVANDKADEAAKSISATITSLVGHQSARFTQAVISARLYGNLSLSGMTGVTQARVSTVANALRERVTFNVVQSVIDTATAQIGENRPKPYFLTSGGDYRAQRKAKRLNQFIEGLFYEAKAYDLGGEAQRDACIWGDGFLHVYAKDERVCVERVLASELFVDEVEAQYGSPRQLHRVKLVDREELAARFPDFADVIAQATGDAKHQSLTGPAVSDLVEVRESWHLPSGPDAGDGRHLISIDGHALGPLEEWAHDFFPFARWRWSPKPFGYWSQGLAEQLQSIQLEINKLLFFVQRSYHLGGTFKVLIQAGSKVVKEHINNDVGTLITYAGTKPEYIVPPLVPMEIYQHILTLIQRAYDQAGVTMMAASGKKPEGLNSGKAIREYRQEADQRHKTASRYNERGYLDLARLCIECAKDIAKANKGHYKANVPGRRFLSKVDWADIGLDEDAYVMQCFPVSSLPSDPAGRLQTIQEFIAAGFLTPRQGKRLLDFPDLEAVESLSSAAEDLIAQALDAMCDDGEYMPPGPEWDLALARDMATEYLLRGQLEGLDDDRLEMLRTFAGQVDMLVQRATPAPAAAQGQLGTPQAVPTAPPVSDLLPNVPQAQQAPPPAVH